MNKKNLNIDPVDEAWEKPIILFARIAVSILFIFSLTSALHPDLRQFVRQTVKGQYRTVVSTVEAHVGEGQFFKVVKVKTQSGIYLEIYNITDKTVQPLVDRIHIPEEKDGFMMFRGQTTNLALDDVNGDNIPEIIAPSFDKNLVAHMNIYKFNKTTNKFEKTTQAF